MTKQRRFMKIAVPIIIIAVGLGIMKILIELRSEPEKGVRTDPGAIVQLLEVEKRTVELSVRGTGTVTAAEEVTINPQVSGRIIRVSPELVVGGFFLKDETLFEIEETDYRLALDRAKAARAKAEYDLATIESQARVARSEWERLNRDDQEEPNPLVLFEPQLKNVLSALASAEASVRQAELDLARTRVQAPFNCRVRQESIDPGQYIKSGSSVAVLSGTDSAEILVPLSLEDLQWLVVPRSGKSEKGSAAVVRLQMGKKVHEWEGRVVRSTGEVDPRTRMIKIVVRIRDPYGLENSPDTEKPSLANGAFVDVRFIGRKLENMFVIPRSAFRDSSTVWIMDEENKLRIRDVVTARIEGEEVMVSDGLAEGDRVVLTNISGAADGMRLRLLKK